MLRRRRITDLQSTAAEFSRVEGPIVFFLGAGFAATSQMPLGDTVRDGAIRYLLGIPDAESRTSIALANQFHQWLADKDWLTTSEAQMSPDEFVSMLTLERVVSAERRIYESLPTLSDFREHHDAVLATPGPAVRNLAKLLQMAQGRIVIAEVNFDQLVETHAGVPVEIFASDSEFESAASYLSDYLAGKQTAIPILKMHGTIERPETCVMTVEQTEQGLGVGKLEALKTLIGADSRALWIYVGMSMRDRDLLSVLIGEEFGKGLDERWVNPVLPETVETYAQNRVEYWKQTQLQTIDDRLITETADAFFDYLVMAWESNQKTG